MGLGPRLVDVADHEQDAGQLPFAQLRLEAFDAAAIGLRDLLADTLAQLGIEAVLGNISERGDEAVVAIAPHEHARARTVEQVENATRDAQQLLARHLPKFLARIGFYDLAQRLGIVPASGKTRLRHHPIGLAPQHRNVARWLGEAFAGEQADEAHFADRLAFCVVALDADIIGGGAPVHARADG